VGDELFKKILVMGCSQLRNIVSYLEAQNTEFFILVSELPYQNESFIGPEIQKIMWNTSADE
jgi:hypothetical protein